MMLDMYEFWDVVKHCNPELTWDEFEVLWQQRLQERELH